MRATEHDTSISDDRTMRAAVPVVALGAETRASNYVVYTCNSCYAIFPVTRWTIAALNIFSPHTNTHMHRQSRPGIFYILGSSDVPRVAGTINIDQTCVQRRL
jgi:hypothetical protein